MGAQVLQHEIRAEHLGKFARLVRIAGCQKKVMHLDRINRIQQTDDNKPIL